jgi:maltose O-acetyltransferase
MQYLLKRLLYLMVRDFPIFNFPVLRKFRNSVYARLYSAHGINVDHRCRIQASHFVAGQYIRFGQSPHIGCNTLIDYTGTIEAGDRLTISDGASIFTHSHPLSGLAQDWRLEPVYHSRLKIGDDVWIACNAVVLETVREIGDGAVVAAGSIVTKDIPAGAIVAGNPAQIVRTRNYLKSD